MACILIHAGVLRFWSKNTSVKNEGMTPYQNCSYKKTLQGKVQSMQQSSATPKKQDVGRGWRKIVAFSVFGTVSSLHLTSFLMLFTLVY